MFSTEHSLITGVVNVHEVANLIRAIGGFAWPVVAVVFLLLFRVQVRQLLRRVVRGKVLGQEIEFADELDRLEQRAIEVKTEATGPDPPELDAVAAEDEVRAILREAATSPKVAVMAISAELERRIRRLSAATGWGASERTPRTMLATMPVPESVKAGIDEFWGVRNKIIHGMAATDADALRAVDSGLAILRALERIPVEKHYVEDPNVPVYADAAGSELRTDVHGVLLRAVSPEREREDFELFPSTRDHFVRGEQVAWEWGPRTWGPTWYRNPATGELEEAWTGAMEFIGRHIADV